MYLCRLDSNRKSVESDEPIRMRDRKRSSAREMRALNQLEMTNERWWNHEVKATLWASINQSAINFASNKYAVDAVSARCLDILLGCSDWSLDEWSYGTVLKITSNWNPLDSATKRSLETGRRRFMSTTYGQIGSLLAALLVDNLDTFHVLMDSFMGAKVMLRRCQWQSLLASSNMLV